MLLYITGGVGFLLSVLAIILVVIFHKKDKKKLVPIIMYFLGFVLFMGSGFLHWKGFEFNLPFKNDSDTPLDLTGEWKQTNSESEDSFHGIYISGDTIEIYWVTEGGDTTALYWAGSFTPPEDNPKEYTWVSENDASRSDTALFASEDETKDFTYKNGELSYSASALGVTTTVKAEKQEWGYKADSAQQVSNDDQGSSKEDVANTEDTNQSVDDSQTAEPEPESASSGELGDFYVEIKDAYFTQGDEGNKVLAVTFAWTNNSDETTNAAVALGERAFQDGIQIDRSSMSSSNQDFDTSAEWRDIRPGTTIDVQCAFELSNETSVVEFEVYELLSLSDDVVTKNFDLTTLE